MFTGINQQICNTAWKIVRQALGAAFELGITNKYAGTVVVLDPTMTEFSVLYQDGFKSHEDFNSLRYIEIAHAKAVLTWRHKLPTSVIQQQFPYLYQEGDTKWGGSTIDAGGLIVAFSGVQPAYDEMISEWMASAIRALCRHEMTRPDGGVMTEDYSFIGGMS